jgi:hypothetical protein
LASTLLIGALEHVPAGKVERFLCGWRGFEADQKSCDSDRFIAVVKKGAAQNGGSQKISPVSRFFKAFCLLDT